MEKAAEAIKKNYQAKLKPHDIHKLHQEVFENKNNLITATLTDLYELTKSGRFKGNKLLEIGSAGTFHNIASACLRYTEVIQSDLVQANCEESRKWLRGESYLDWSNLLRVVAKIEGYEDLDAGCREIEARIRKSVKCIVHSDLLVDQVLPEEVTTEYDVIIASLTIECAAPDFNSFVEILKRLNCLLRSGGGLVMIDFLNGESKWKTNGGEFHYLPVGQGDINRALDMSGFKEKVWTLYPKTDDFHFEHENYYFLVATKL